MKHKTTPVDTHAGTGAGEFTALASVFNNVDRVGDRVMPGAFDRTLTDWRASGKQLPVVYSHNTDDVWAFVGSADPNDVAETTEGLFVKGTLDIEDNPTARQVHKLMSRGNLTGWSFGYSVKRERRARDGVNELLEVELFEVGPTLVGANPEAQLVGIKSHTYTRRQLDAHLAAHGITPPAIKSAGLQIARYTVR